ncbi:hypothetical protein BH09MYX1_BH09MYX1_52580 [soil metagenome]
MRPSLFTLLSLAALAGSACSASGTTGFTDSGNNNPVDGGTTDGNPLFEDAAGDVVVPPSKAVLYANDNTTLFELDPENLSSPLKNLGNFDCIGGTGQPTSMTDIAIDKSGKLYGVSQVAAYPLTLQGGGVHCDDVWTLPANTKFYGLSFAPENTVAAEETLVAANDAGEIYAISKTGQPTILGNFGKDGSNKPFELSGDIVFLSNGGQPVGFATVRVCPTSGSCTTIPDTLVQIDLAKLKLGNTTSVVKSVRGVLKQGSNCTNKKVPPSYGSMYGIAAYKDQIYGFSHAGGVVLINNGNASVCLASVPQTSGGDTLFAGAGVTTVVSIIPPPN